MTAVPDEGASQLKQAQVIGGLLVVAHQYPPALGEPTQGAFHHPPSGGKGFLAPSVQLLLPNAPDMRTVPEGSNGPVAGGIVIPFVQAQVLGAFRACHYDALQGRPQEFRVMDVGSSHHHAQGAASCVHQDALLAPSFAPVGGVASNGAPPNRALPMEQSADCHSQSTPPNSWHSSIRAAQMPSSTPPPTQRWKGPMDGAIVSQLPGQVVPLATAAHPKDNAFQHLPLVRPFAPPGFGRVQLQYHRFDSFPKVVRNIPNSR